MRSRDLKKNKKEKHSKSKAADGLTALINVATGYTGDLTPFGTVSLRFNEDDSFLLKMDMSGLDPACESCVVCIHEGSSCEEPGNAYYATESDPWATGTSYYFSYGDSGIAGNGFTIYNGYDEDENEGKVVSFLDSSNTMIACGVLEETPSSTMLKAEIGSYPGYTGDLEVEGKVTVSFSSDSTFEFSYDLEGLEEECIGCGIHIHAGMSCDDADLVLGHGWQTVITQDLWTAAGGSVYNAVDGKSEGSFMLYNGYSYIENRGHAVVVHGSDGTRIGCGVLN